MTTVDIDVDSRELDNLLYRVMIPRTSGASIRQFLTRRAWPFLKLRIVGRFQTEGDDVSGKWAELALNTKRIRGSRGFPTAHPINRRTGDMERFLTSSFSVAGGTTGNATLSIPGRTGNLEMKHKLAVAQTGVDAHAARPVLALADIDRQAIEGDLWSWINGGVL